MQSDSAGGPEDKLDEQKQHWEKSFARRPDMFGAEPSDPARKALVLFKREGIRNILELGGGRGRNTIFFGQSGLQVSVLDYTENGVKDIARRAEALNLSDAITALRHDVRDPLPFDDAAFGRVLFAHALLHGA